MSRMAPSSLLALAACWLPQPAVSANAGGPPERRPSPGLQRLVAMERRFEAERQALLDRLAAEAHTAARPVSSKLKQLREVLLAALAAPDENGLCRLHHAVLDCDAARVRSLVRAGAQTDVAAGEPGVLPLHLTILAGDRRPGCLQELLDGGADVDAPDANGVTALHAACNLNMPRLASILLAAGAAPDVRSRFGVFPLQLAGWANSAEAAEAMLAAGAPPDTRDDGMRTAGHAAAASDASEALEVLLSFGAHREARDKRGWTPLFYAIRACPCCDPACDRTRALALLLANGASVDATDAAGWTPLHHAAASNRVAAVALLLANGADPSAAAEGTGCRPLMLAGHAGGTEVARLLLGAGALPTARDDAGTTALHAAADAAAAETLGLLLRAIRAGQADGDVDGDGGGGGGIEGLPGAGSVAAGSSGRGDPRRRPATEDGERAAQPSVADTDVPSADGAPGAPPPRLTPAGAATSADAAVRAAASHRDIAGRTPLHFAAAAGCDACVRQLAAAGADMAAASEIGWQPLHQAANASQAGVVATLLELGAPAGAADPDGTTALHLAALRVSSGANGCDCKWCRGRRRRSLRTMRSLLECEACDPDASNRLGVRPAHMAAAGDSAHALRLLRRRRAALWARDAQGRMPMDVARMARRGKPSEVVRMLLLLGRPPLDAPAAGADAGTEGVGGK